jgi:alpha-D-ribose 1-methylphosphonate 5-triphosphate synthase subunit PhnH
MDLREGDASYMPVLRTLLDHEVTFALVGKSIETVNISLVTGSRRTPIDEADYISVVGWDSARTVCRAKKGDLRYPDKGAIITYLVRSLPSGSMKLSLKGPGVPREKTFTVDGFSVGEVRETRALNSAFPLGVDCMFVDKAVRTVAVPRSTRTEVA